MPLPPRTTGQAGLSDGLGRRITYLRMSVTDRCDMRCRYCMAEEMAFLPRAELLALEEIAAIADRFIARGVRKIRLTGGEPLVRRGIADLARMIGRHLGSGLDELTLTTNGNRLGEHAQALFDAGMRRVNVSIDSLDPERFRSITRTGDLARVLDGIAEARRVGLRIKVNMVALKGFNEADIAPMLRWCGAQGHDLTLIETMPLGVVDEDRTDRYLPLSDVKRDLERAFTLLPTTDRTGGPARYWHVAETGGRLGLITPMSHNFCDSCNRMRLTTEGKLFMCLGHEDRVDLRAAIRGGVPGALDDAIDEALRLKPARHDFRIGKGAAPAVSRHMSVTGG